MQGLAASKSGLRKEVPIVNTDSVFKASVVPLVNTDSVFKALVVQPRNLTHRC